MEPLMSWFKSVDRASYKAWLFLVSVVLWAVWLGWRVLDYFLILFPDLSRRWTDLRALPIGWLKASLVPLLLAAWLAWSLLPLLLLMFYAALVDRSTLKSFPARLIYAAREIGGAVASATLITIVWSGAVIVFAYTSGLIDFLVVIAVVVVILIGVGRSLVEKLKRKRRGQQLLQAPNTVGRADS